MTTLLRIDASARTDGSRTRALCDHFEHLWRASRPGGEVVVRDLARDPVPHLDAAGIEAFVRGGEHPLSDALIAELRAADQVLVGTPIYNFGVPSPLKAWVDHIVRGGATFEFTADGPRGLLGGRSACVVTTRGGTRATDRGVETDFATPMLRTALGFVGIERVDVVALEGTAAPGDALDRGLECARGEIERIIRGVLASDVPATAEHWVGAFEDEDRAQIDELRRAQMAAIESGDAEAYAALCADDIALALQDSELVIGRTAFVERERALLAGTRFRAVRQLPERVERRGDLAVEVGRQEVELEPGAEGDDAYRARRKYVHVMRRTPIGWRFAVLTSNNG